MSIPSVVRRTLCIQVRLIRESPDQSLFDGYPGHIAAFHALHRLLAPRHPPYALSNLTTNPQSSWPKDQEGRGQRTENIQPMVGATGAEAPAQASETRWVTTASYGYSVVKEQRLIRPTNQATSHRMELTGIEPVTSALQKRRSPN